MIRERNIVQKLQVVFVVERTPAAVAILHAPEPGKPSANRTKLASRLRIRHASERHQYKCGIVHVGIKIVLEFKGPSTRLGPLILYLPVPGAENLVIEQPTPRCHKRRMRGIEPGLLE